MRLLYFDADNQTLVRDELGGDWMVQPDFYIQPLGPRPNRRHSDDGVSEAKIAKAGQSSGRGSLGPWRRASRSSGRRSAVGGRPLLARVDLSQGLAAHRGQSIEGGAGDDHLRPLEGLA